jgi:hypothetical protein
MKIDFEKAVGAVRRALDFEMPDAGSMTDELFDTLAYRLRRNPRFAGFSIIEVDCILASAKSEFEHELDAALSNVDQRLVQTFEDEIGLDDEIAA